MSTKRRITTIERNVERSQRNRVRLVGLLDRLARLRRDVAVARRDTKVHAEELFSCCKFMTHRARCPSCMSCVAFGLFM